MSTPFKQTTRALNRERHRLVGGLAVALFLLAGLWIWWFGAGAVPVHRQGNARVVAVAEPHVITAHRNGRVAEHQLQLNRRVQRGDLLLRLDQTAVQKALEQTEADLDLHRQTLAQITAAAQRQQVLARKALESADLRLQQAKLAVERHELRLQAAEDKLARYRPLRQRGEIAELDFAEMEQAAREARQEGDQLQLTQQLRASERAQAKTEADNQAGELARRRDQAERDIRSAASEQQRLTHEAAQYVVTAPADGVLAEVRPLQNDAYVEAGRELGRLLTEQTLMVRAWFHPADAVGRISAGDSAEMRLDGFPWLQYGSLTLRVREVAGEWRNERVRIDFDILATPPGIPLQHGLPGQVLVRGETVTPLQMLLRTVGGRRAAQQPTRSEPQP
ncbi:HlyD family secretion protein [Acanthopleuribacter pedis]|uniref:HlyD family efflux transporter periplasmic adaptor subunit n=1 Tax=Acanthopleuribacter pedis TaxID=442870 RepID=A0A8J7Q3E4_9BACT|nr:HlyD family efflux transporter periplasmic adaptor subunit [Acanthopleuribacter pedis]MBO1317367.1 HlyD family efflux transporter periplasmic adaptor subunit [Acanthopleuribacter pedis]MBO1318674.1 HlyD family efflux transporter periplasmic adaptor subunit [Acanthopleuribacter pedis]